MWRPANKNATHKMERVSLSSCSSLVLVLFMQNLIRNWIPEILLTYMELSVVCRIPLVCLHRKDSVLHHCLSLDMLFYKKRRFCFCHCFSFFFMSLVKSVLCQSWKGKHANFMEGRSADANKCNIIFLSGLLGKLRMRNASLASPASLCISLQSFNLQLFEGTSSGMGSPQQALPSIGYCFTWSRAD